jgi:hypothetical protein
LTSILQEDHLNYPLNRKEDRVLIKIRNVMVYGVTLLGNVCTSIVIISIIYFIFILLVKIACNHARI